MASRSVLAAALAIAAIFAAGCGGGHGGAETSHVPAALAVHSAVWPDAGVIEPPYACAHSGDHGVSPPVSWRPGPRRTKFYAVTVTDPDAGDFLHWAAMNLPEDTTTLRAGETPQGQQLRNDFGYLGYGAPCPPGGKPHHYRLTVWALRAPAHTIADLRKEALAQGSITATFGR